MEGRMEFIPPEVEGVKEEVIHEEANARGSCSSSTLPFEGHLPHRLTVEVGVQMKKEPMEGEVAAAAESASQSVCVKEPQELGAVCVKQEPLEDGSDGDSLHSLEQITVDDVKLEEMDFKKEPEIDKEELDDDCGGHGSAHPLECVYLGEMKQKEIPDPLAPDDIKTKVKHWHLCSECPIRCPSRSELCRHQRTHTGERPFPCTSCGKRFARASHLRRHCAAFHAVLAPFCCSSCSATFSHMTQRRAHIRSVHPMDVIMRHLCAVCGRRFKKTWQLDRHLRMHAQERPYECEKCGKRFAELQHLRLHKRTHTGERPYGCPQCTLQFAEKGTLKRHVRRLHTPADYVHEASDST